MVTTTTAATRYLLTHADNVTLCGADGGVHVGDGACASPVPTCESPETPDDGEMVLSSPYVLPGTTATYACPQAGTFLQGPALRTCTQGTGDNKKNRFDGADPKCTYDTAALAHACIEGEVDTDAVATLATVARHLPRNCAKR